MSETNAGRPTKVEKRFRVKKMKAEKNNNDQKKQRKAGGRETKKFTIAKRVGCLFLPWSYKKLGKESN